MKVSAKALTVTPKDSTGTLVKQQRDEKPCGPFTITRKT